MEHIENQVRLRGNLLALPQLSHENHGKKFYRFTLEVARHCRQRSTCCSTAEAKSLLTYPAKPPHF